MYVHVHVSIYSRQKSLIYEICKHNWLTLETSRPNQMPGFYVKHLRITNSPQVKLKVKLAVTFNAALDLSWNFSCVSCK